MKFRLLEPLNLSVGLFAKTKAKNKDEGQHGRHTCDPST